MNAFLPVILEQSWSRRNAKKICTLRGAKFVLSKFAEDPIPLLGPVRTATASLYPRYFIRSGRRLGAGETAKRTLSEESPANGNRSEPDATPQGDTGTSHSSTQAVSTGGAGRAVESSGYSLPHSTATPDRSG